MDSPEKTQKHVTLARAKMDYNCVPVFKNELEEENKAKG